MPAPQDSARHDPLPEHRAEEHRPYRRTVLDRFGPGFGRVLAATGWCGFGALLIVPAVGTHVPPHWPPLLTVTAAYFLTWALLLTVSLLLISPVGAVAEFYLAPTGASTPYEEQFSQEQSLVMQGRVAEALEAFERRIAADPGSIAARIRAADLYAVPGPGADPARAAALFLEARRQPALRSGDDLYIGNRLADLYLGPLQTPARALVELRRLVERYPDSRVAPQLRQAIAALKVRHLPDDRGS